jgi:PAS domain S-box-containing protein
MRFKSSRDGLQGYGVALLAVLTALLASSATWPVSRSSPWVFFFAAVMATAWFGGQRSSFVATMGLALFGRYFFVRPYHTLSMSRENLVVAAVFIGVSLFIGYLAAARWRAMNFERAERRRFQATVSSIGDGLIATDAAGRVTFLNGVAEGLTGWALAEANGRRLEEVFVIVNEGTREPTQNPVAMVMETGKAQGLVNQSLLIARDGTERPIDDSAAPIMDDGRIAGIVLVFREITERKRAEAERARLAAESDRDRRIYHAALSNTPDLVYVFGLDHRFIYANEALLGIWGRSWDQAIGKDCLGLGYEPWHAAMHDREIDQVVATRGPIRGEVPFNGTGGRRIYEYIFTPVIGAGGAVEAVAGTSRDVTDRKRSEEELKVSEQRFRLTADNAPVLIWLAGTDKLYYWFNKPWLEFTGRTMEQEYGKGWTEGVHPDDLDRCLGIYHANFEARSPFKMDYRLRHRDGRYRWVVDNGIPLHDHDGGFTGYIGSCVDIQDRVAAEEELREHDRQKDEFLAMLAHELRNPLSAVGNAVTVLKMSSNAADVGFAQDVITRQMRHLTRLIDDLLDVSRISRGKIELRREVVEATPILDSATESVRPLIGERKHSLEVDVERGELWVDADPTRLEQVVVNLLNNAAKYSENSGRIRLSARNEGDEVVIRVGDEGIGIPPEKLPQMFELFAQGDRSLARSEGGLGIGLTVVKKLVEMHGGTVAASSEGPGKGSVFAIRLPAAGRQGVGKSPPEARGASAARRARILVVDDNVDTARGMSRLLKLLGHDIATAYSGLEALEVARKHRPEFVLLDIGLPGMDGYEVASRLRREQCCEGAMIVAVSGYGQEEDRRRSRDAGFDFHLIKPVDPDVLVALLFDGQTDRSRGCETDVLSQSVDFGRGV